VRREGDTKQKLLRTAIELIWENSYGSISVDDICERAGVNKGSFYYAFKTKSDLAVAAYEEHANRKRPTLDRIFSSQEPPLARLENYCDQVVNDQIEKYMSFGRVLGCPFVSVGCELSTQDEGIRRKTEEVAERVVRYLTGAIRDAVAEGSIRTADPARLAEEAYYFVIGVLTQAKIENDPEVLNRLKPGVARILMTQFEEAIAA
jgi:TetR/AcrR family transcriptional regulator, transcriptional repressor for nem operon